MSETESNFEGQSSSDLPDYGKQGDFTTNEPAPLPEENEVAVEFDGTDPLPREDQAAVEFEVHDDEDVAALLARDTTDGPGFENENELPKSDFESFAEENGDLLAWKPSILDQYYDRATLDSDLARRAFVMPKGLSADGADVRR